MAHRVPKCKIDTAWKALVAMLWRDKCSANVNDSLDFSFHAFTCIVGAILYAGESLGYCSRNHPFLCVCVGDVSSVCLRVWLHICVQVHVEARDQPWAQELSIFVFWGKVSHQVSMIGWGGVSGQPQRSCLFTPNAGITNMLLFDQFFYVSKCVAATFLSLLVFI